LPPEGTIATLEEIERGKAYVQWIVDQMDDRHVVEGIAFFEKIRDIVGRR